MKTAFGKLSLLIFMLTMALLMLAPMRSGIEDSLVCTVDAVSLEPGETIAVGYELMTETAQTVLCRSDDASVAIVDQRGQITAVSPGKTKIWVIAQGGASDFVDVSVSGVPVKSFSLNTHEVEMDLGDVSGLSYQFNSGVTAQRVTWKSADPEVVLVDAAGRLSAVGAGETVVTATTAGGLSDSAHIRVNLRGSAAWIEPSEMTVGTGAIFALEVHFQPEGATDEPVSWVSSAPQVVWVSDEGMIRAVSTGAAVITMTTRDGLSASVRINVNPASRAFMLDVYDVTVERGESRALKAWFTGADGMPLDDGRYIRWVSSDPSVASVEDGVVTGIASGEATITAIADGYEVACDVTVRTSVSEVHLNVKEQTLYRSQADEPFLIRATVIPADADDRMLTFSSDNELVATVSQNGLVTMTGGYGTAVITAEAASGAKASCTINVVMSEEEKRQ